MSTLHGRCQLAAVETGQPDVREHEIDALVLVENLERLGRIDCFDDVESEVAQRIGRKQPDGVVVFDHEDRFPARTSDLPRSAAPSARSSALPSSFGR